MKQASEIHEILYDPIREEIFLTVEKTDHVVSGFMVDNEGYHMEFHLDTEEWSRMKRWNEERGLLGGLIAAHNLVEEVFSDKNNKPILIQIL